MPVINEFEPNPTGSDNATQVIELKGVPGATFNGAIVSVEGDTAEKSIDRSVAISGVFDANGLLSVEIPDLENPSFTLLLLSGVAPATGPLLAGTLTSANVLDALGIPDAVADEANTDPASIDPSLSGFPTFAYTGDEPKLVFRDGVTGEWYALNDPDRGEVIDINGDAVDPDIFNSGEPLNDTLGGINPSASVRRPVINEFEPNPFGSDPATQTVELKGVAGTTFTGNIVTVDSDTDNLIVDRVTTFTGTFDVNGLLTVEVADLENPSFIMLLTTGAAPTIGATAVAQFDASNVVDAIGIPDATTDVARSAPSAIDASLSGFPTFQFTGDEPKRVFRDSVTNEWYAVNDPDRGVVIDINGNAVDASAFQSGDPLSTDFGAVNPTTDGLPPPPPVAENIVINEIDSDTTGTDTAEFIELYDGGAGNTSLDGLVVVLFNGSSDTSYSSIDLSGQTTDENGFFVIGSASVPNVDLVAFTSNGVQNGADAVALYKGTAAEFPTGTAPTTTNLLDALVYDTSDGDDAGLLAALGQGAQINENGNGAKDTDSVSRVPDGSGAFVAQDATPGAANIVDVDPPDPDPVFTFIHDIQGSSAGVTRVGLDDASALEGQAVTIEAVVTAEFLSGGLNGFFVQEEDADADADTTTSEGIFVSTFNSGAPAGLAIGDLVTVTGTVDEFFGETRVVATNIGVISSGNTLPTVTAVDLGAMGAIETDSDDLDYVSNLEAYEGMLVSFTNSLVISELFNLDRFGQYTVSADDRPVQFTQDNAPDAVGFAAHLQEVAAKSIVLDDGLTEQNPDQLQIIDGNNGVLDAGDSFRMGDTLDGVTGVVAYGFDEFRIHDAEGIYSQTNARPDTPEDVGGTFKVASLNVLNFFTTLDDGTARTDTGAEPRGADDLTRFDTGSPLANTVPDAEYQRQLEKAVAAIVEIDADVLGLVEVENTNDSRAVATLVEAVNAALGAEVYSFVNTGIVGGDAITNGIIYKTDSVNLAGDHAILETFNGRDFVDPLGAGRGLNRPTVAQTFEDVESGELITVAVNHLKSKGSLSGLPVDEAQGDGQGNNNATRTEAVDILAEWLASDPTGTGAVNQMILGDLNAYAQEDPLTTLEAAGFSNVASATDYSFVFDGQIGTLDYILINDALADNFAAATEWHINADEPDAIDYNLDFGRDPNLYNGDTAARNSDHDPIIAGFTFEALPEPNLVVGTAGRDRLVGTDADDEIRSLAGSLDQMTGGQGADTFVFGPETSNGMRERDIIMDYEVGVDTILFEGDVSIASVREVSNTVILFLDGDRDAIYVRGEGVTAENLSLQFTDEFALG